MKRTNIFFLALLLTFNAFATPNGNPGDIPEAQDDEHPSYGTAPEEIWSEINQEWQGPLKEVEPNLNARKNYIVWINVPAQHPMDLRSADQFRKWTMATPPRELTISHNMVAWRCRANDGQMHIGATGLTGGNGKQDLKMFLDGFGLSTMFAVYTDGHLNPVWEVGKYISKNLATRGAIFAGFEVSEDQCSSMLGFLREFVWHPNKPYRNFGLIPQPDRFEGGGCVTMASVLLQKAGLLESVAPSFFRTLVANRKLMGGNLIQPKGVALPPVPWLKGKPRFISISRLLYSQWDEPSDTMIDLKLMDPEKMAYSLKQMGKVYLQNAPEELRTSDAAFIESSQLGTRVVVTKELFAQLDKEAKHTPINDEFDLEMAQIGKEAREYFEEQVASGKKIRLGRAVGMPVLLLENR